MSLSFGIGKVTESAIVRAAVVASRNKRWYKFYRAIVVLRLGFQKICNLNEKRLFSFGITTRWLRIKINNK